MDNSPGLRVIGRKKNTTPKNKYTPAADSCQASDKKVKLGLVLDESSRQSIDDLN